MSEKCLEFFVPAMLDKALKRFKETLDILKIQPSLWTWYYWGSY